MALTNQVIGGDLLITTDVDDTSAEVIGSQVIYGATITGTITAQFQVFVGGKWSQFDSATATKTAEIKSFVRPMRCRVIFTGAAATPSASVVLSPSTPKVE